MHGAFVKVYVFKILSEDPEVKALALSHSARLKTSRMLTSRQEFGGKGGVERKDEIAVYTSAFIPALHVPSYLIKGRVINRLL